MLNLYLVHILSPMDILAKSMLEYKYLNPHFKGNKWSHEGTYYSTNTYM